MTSFALLSLSIAIIESMAGILGNGIILAASSSGCIECKTWPPYDMIIISLSSSGFILQSWTTLDLLTSIFYEPSYYIKHVFAVSKTIFTVLNYSSLWFGAWLSVFYCIKVASFTQSFFIWLKQRISRLVPWMLLISWLCSFTVAIPFVYNMSTLVYDNFTAPLPMKNSSAMKTTKKENLGLLILLCNAGIGLPLILSVVSSVLLIQSLWIHTRQMQQNASGFSGPSLEAHMKAIKSVCSFLILYIIYFICMHVILFNIYLSNAEVFCVVLMVACPTGHSVVIIWSNPKFRELPAKIWHRISCHVRTASM